MAGPNFKINGFKILKFVTFGFLKLATINSSGNIGIDLYPAKQVMSKIENWLERSFSGRRFYLIIILFFIFRLWIGLTQRFWSWDEIQVYLIGLKHFTTGEWPYWGPDIVYTGSRIPGALQGLLISVPLMIRPIPEAPIIFINLLSFGAICLFAWYLSKSGIEIPKWFIWGFLLVCPWTTEFSAHIVNPSYVLFGSILFFIGFIDVTRLLNTSLLNRKLGFFFMGFSLVWIFQLHISWVLLLPFILFAFIRSFIDRKKFGIDLVFFSLGFILSSSTLIPTVFTYPEILTGGMERNLVFSKGNIVSFFALFGRFVAFSGFDISRFMSSIMDLTRHLRYDPFMYPIAIVLVLSTLALIVFAVRSLFLKKGSQVFKNVRKLFIAAFLLAYVSFLFSIKKPIGYTFYILFPVSVLFIFIIIQPLFQKQLYRNIWLLLLGFSIIYSLSNSIFILNHESLYTNRMDVVKAIENREYTFADGFRRDAFFEKPTQSLWIKNSIKTPGNNKLVEMLCDFEYPDNLTRPQYISRQKSYSGDYACVMHKNCQFSSSLSMPVNEIISDTIQTSFQMFSEQNDTLLWVIAFEKAGEKDHWFSVPVVTGDTKDWEFHNYSFKIPPYIPDDAILKTYIWKPDKEKMNIVYLDDFMIKWMSKSEYQ